MRGYLGLAAVGTGLGAGLMFLLDPGMGRRRRAIARDKTFHFLKSARAAADKTARDVKNRVRGTIVSAKSGHGLDVGRLSILQRNWPPAIRLLMGTTGGLLTAAGVKRGGITGSIAAGIGACVAALAITNYSVRDVITRSSTKVEEHRPSRLRGLDGQSYQPRTGQRNAA